MIRTVVQCDFCGEQRDIEIGSGIYSGMIEVNINKIGVKHYCNAEHYASDVENVSKQIVSKKPTLAEAISTAFRSMTS